MPSFDLIDVFGNFEHCTKEERIYKIVSAINTGGRFFFFLRKECKKYTIDENEDEAKTTSPVAAGEAEAHLHE